MIDTLEARMFIEPAGPLIYDSVLCDSFISFVIPILLSDNINRENSQVHGRCWQKTEN